MKLFIIFLECELCGSGRKQIYKKDNTLCLDVVGKNYPKTKLKNNSQFVPKFECKF